VICILRYRRGAPGQGLPYRNHKHMQTDGYINAERAGSPDDRHAGRYCVFF